MTFAEFQEEVRRWTEHNFPTTSADQAFKGMAEELGEIAHANLKAEQGIRGNPEEHRGAEQDAIGDLLVYVAHYCLKRGFDLQTVITTTWAMVRERDWVKYPHNGKTW